jgi:hypothetical protein
MGGELEELPDRPDENDVDWLASSELDFEEFE